jgi:hypothetical protein
MFNNYVLHNQTYNFPPQTSILEHLPMDVAAIIMDLSPFMKEQLVESATNYNHQYPTVKALACALSWVVKTNELQFMDKLVINQFISKSM